MIALARTICTPEDRFLEMLPHCSSKPTSPSATSRPSRRQELIAESSPTAGWRLSGWSNAA